MKKNLIVILLLVFCLFSCKNKEETVDEIITENIETPEPTQPVETPEPITEIVSINVVIIDTITNEENYLKLEKSKLYSKDELGIKEYDGYDFVGLSYKKNEDINTQQSYSFTEDVNLFANYKINDEFFLVDKVYDVYITCGESITDKYNYKNATITIEDKEYNLDTDVLIRLRGNSTLHQPKKPYKLKFDKKVNLLGMAEDKEWALLANYFDPTHMRNYYAYKLAIALGLEYSIDLRFVNLFLNGSNQGLYLLTETVKTSSNRVDIEEKNLTGEEVPFLLELDMKVVDDNPNYRDILDDEAFILSNEKYNGKQYPFSTEYPKSFKDLSSEQYKYIKNYMKNVFTSVRSGNFSEYIDLESFIDYFLVQEIFMNVDLDYSSVFMYKPLGEKLHFGPIWDFDLSSGNVSYVNNYHSETTMKECNGGNYLFTKALENQKFNTMVNDRIAEIEYIIRRMLSSFDANYTKLLYYATTDNLKWYVLNDHNWARPEHLVGITYREQVDFLKNYLAQHYSYLRNAKL